MCCLTTLETDLEIDGGPDPVTGALKVLEPEVGKLARPVLREGSHGNVTLLLEKRISERHVTGWSDDTSRYLYDSDVEIGCLGSGPFELRLMMDRGGWLRPRTVEGEVKGESFCAVINFRGDITALYNKPGSCVESMRYPAFGDQEVDGQAISPWGFAGKRLDDSGFVYFGRRYYLPSEGHGGWLPILGVLSMVRISATTLPFPLRTEVTVD